MRSLNERENEVCNSYFVILPQRARGTWRQWADDRLGDPSPPWIRELLVVKDKD